MVIDQAMYCDRLEDMITKKQSTILGQLQERLDGKDDDIEERCRSIEERVWILLKTERHRELGDVNVCIGRVREGGGVGT